MHPRRGLELERWLGLHEFHERTNKEGEEGPSEGEKMRHTRNRRGSVRGKGERSCCMGISRVEALHAVKEGGGRKLEEWWNSPPWPWLCRRCKVVRGRSGRQAASAATL